MFDLCLAPIAAKKPSQQKEAALVRWMKESHARQVDPNTWVNSRLADMNSELRCHRWSRHDDDYICNPAENLNLPIIEYQWLNIYFFRDLPPEKCTSTPGIGHYDMKESVGIFCLESELKAKIKQLAMSSVEGSTLSAYSTFAAAIHIIFGIPSFVTIDLSSGGANQLFRATLYLVRAHEAFGHATEPKPTFLISDPSWTKNWGEDFSFHQFAREMRADMMAIDYLLNEWHYRDEILAGALGLHGISTTVEDSDSPDSSLQWQEQLQRSRYCLTHPYLDETGVLPKPISWHSHLSILRGFFMNYFANLNNEIIRALAPYTARGRMNAEQIPEYSTASPRTQAWLQWNETMKLYMQDHPDGGEIRKYIALQRETFFSMERSTFDCKNP